MASLGCIGATGFIYKDKIWDYFDQELKTYLVQAKTISTNKLDKYYFCETDDEVDEKCFVSLLSFNSQNFLLSKELLKPTERLTSTLEENSFYKLTIDKNKIKDDDFLNGKTTITIKNLSKEVIGVLKIITLISEETVKEESKEFWGDSKILVQANKSVSSTINTQLSKCVIGNEKEEISCNIYEFNNSQSNKNIIDFSKIKKVDDWKIIQSGRYYIIDFSESETSQKNKLNDINKIKIIAAKDTTEEKTNFSLISKIIAHIDEEQNSNKNKAIILKNNFQNNDNHSTFMVAKSESNSTNNGISYLPKNYKCAFSEGKKEKNDDNCSLSELNDNEKTLLEIKNSNNTKTTGTKWYKVVANNEIIDAITLWDGSKKIKVKSNVSNSTQEYKKLEPVFLVEKETLIKGSTKLSIATFITPNNTETNIAEITDKQTYKCKVDSLQNSENCQIYKLFKTFNKKNVDSTIFENLSQSLKKEDWAKGSSFLVEMKETTKFDVNNLNDSSHIIVFNATNNREIARLKINSLVASLESFDVKKIKNSLIIF